MAGASTFYQGEEENNDHLPYTTEPLARLALIGSIPFYGYFFFTYWTVFYFYSSRTFILHTFASVHHTLSFTRRLGSHLHDTAIIVTLFNIWVQGKTFMDNLYLQS